MDVPRITSLVVRIEPRDPRSRILPWKEPCLELLKYLKVTSPNGQRFCFQPSHDLSKISRVFLSVYTPHIRGDIDLGRLCLSGPQNIGYAAAKLEEYANHVLQRIHRFTNCLVKRKIIQDSTRFLHIDLFTCPICFGPLISCVDCDAEVACSSPTCIAAWAIECKCCFVHNRMTCHACLATSDTIPSLVRCPQCQCWRCREDFDWCVGLVKQPALGTEELEELSQECNWDSETIVRSHPPKPSLCMFCTSYAPSMGWPMSCRNRTNDTEPVPDICPSQTSFIKRYRLRAAYCLDCFNQSPGHRCACGVSWLCETCFAIGNGSRDHPYLITCPRCGVDYCTNSATQCEKYIEICRGCKGAIICSDCQEEEVLPGDIQTSTARSEQIVFDGQCSYCESWTCGDCLTSPDSTICCFCDKWFCIDCLTDKVHIVIRQCPCCALYVCVDCVMNHEYCPGDAMLKMRRRNKERTTQGNLP